MAERSEINELINDLVQPDEVDRFSDPIEARKKAMDYLARREHSRDELIRKLEKAGFQPNATVDAIEQLKKDGLQSDSRFVEAFVESRVNQGKGPTRIRADLRERGVRDAVIDEGLTTVVVDWYELARSTRVKKFGAEQPLEFKDKARQMRFLQYRGFETDHIQTAVSDSGD